MHDFRTCYATVIAYLQTQKQEIEITISVLKKYSAMWEAEQVRKP